MEELIIGDATFEVCTNSNDSKLLNNRVLKSYPSEKSSFQVDLGFDGYSNFEDKLPLLPSGTVSHTNTSNKLAGTEKTDTTSKYDPEKISGAIVSAAGVISSLSSTVQAFKGDGTKAPKRKKLLKDACGKKPLFSKDKKKAYNDCVAKFNAGNVTPTGKAPSDSGNTPPASDDTKTSSSGNTKKIVIGVVVVAVVITAIVGFKQGWFGSKAG